MGKAIYNSAIPQSSPKPVNHAFRFVLALCLLASFVILLTPLASGAADWNAAEQQLARKIVAATGPGAMTLNSENRSSLSRRDADIVQNGLKSSLEQMGIHLVGSEQSAANINFFLSENATSYVWVAEIHQGSAPVSVVMTSLPRIGRAAVSRDSSMPLSLRKTLLWTQDDPILDVAVLEENLAHIAVLTPEAVSFYRSEGGKWHLEQTLAIHHIRPWPLDMRGRIVPARDHFLDAYLPGVICHSSATGNAMSLNCQESDDPWPLTSPAMSGGFPAFPSAFSGNRSSSAVPELAGFYAPSRNFFTGVLAPAIGKFSTVPKFYSAALLPRDNYTLWFFAATDGKVHVIDGMSDVSARLDWGSDLAAVRTPCGAGWQVLSTSAGQQNGDSLRAYEVPDRDPVPVSSALDLPGRITALWTEPKGDTAVAVVRDSETGAYEAFRVALACQ